MTGCARCTGITPDQVDALAVVGGSHYPFSEPYGQLRTCRGCGAHFVYTYDHDNEIGYVADAPTLTALTAERLRSYLPRAIAVAQKQLDYFRTQTGDYAKGCVANYEAELAALNAALTSAG